MTQIEKPCISAKELAILGLQHVAYVKRITIADGIAFAVHAADGTELVTLPDQATAFAMIRQYDLEPVSVH